MKRWLLLLLIPLCTGGCRAPMPDQSSQAWIGLHGAALYHIFNARGGPASAAGSLTFSGLGSHAGQCCTGTSLEGRAGGFNLGGPTSGIATLLSQRNIALAAALAQNYETIDDFIAATSADSAGAAVLLSVLHDMLSAIDSAPSEQNIATGSLQMTALLADTQTSITPTDVSLLISPDLFSGEKTAVGPADPTSSGSARAVAITEPDSLSLLLLATLVALAVGVKSAWSSRKIGPVG